MAHIGKIVFSSGSAADFDIWSYDLGSKRLAQRTIGGNLNDYPRWSPDGSKIAYISTQQDMVSSLWVMNADGSEPRRLTTGVHCQHPSWAPDGGSVLFVSNAGSRTDLEISSITLAGGPVQTILRRAGVESEPSWSPDGRFILFAAAESVDANGIASRNTDIYELEVTTGKIARLTNHPTRDFSPRYSPDGRQIAFISHRNAKSGEQYVALTTQIQSAIKAGDMRSVNRAIREIQALDMDSDIWLMDRCGTNQKALTDNDDTELGVSWSPDGQHLVYTYIPHGRAHVGRLRVIEISSGATEEIEFDRTPLESEIGATAALNSSFLQKLLPDFIEARMVSPSFWGQERNPDWCR